MKKKSIMRFLASLLFFLYFPLFGVPADWKEFSKSESKPALFKFLKCKLDTELKNELCVADFPEEARALSTNTGIFITLVHFGKVRGCFGAFYHKTANVEKILEDYLLSALHEDPRYPPLEAHELENTRIILTIGERPFNVRDFKTIPLKSFGILLTKENGQSFVYVPAELKSYKNLKEIIRKENIQEVAAFKAITIK